MESFYGGKRGTSFVIAASYGSIEKMATAFGQTNCPVKYGEYALINTTNKGNPDNGRLYKRGYATSGDELNGAEYVGTIVGPSGPGTNLSMTTIDDAQAKYQKFSIGGIIGTESKGEYIPYAGLVPGVADDGTVNDRIKWYSCSYQTATEGDASAYIGFEFPYMVTDWTAEIVSATPGANAAVTRTDNKKNPYYQQWHLKIPRGYQGNGFNNLRVITADDSIADYDGKQDDINNGRQIFVYDSYNGETQETIPVYLGDYNMIKSINLTDTGNLTIQYTHNNTTTMANKIKWIKSLTLNSETGKFVVTYNTGDEYSSTLKWVNGMSIKENGTVSLTYTDTSTSELSEKIKWASGLDVATNGVITIKYNDGTTSTLDNKAKWIKDISLADNGKLTVYYNNGDDNYTADLKWPISIDVNDEGTVTITYNNGETVEHQNYLKAIKDVSIDDETQKFKISYNTGQEDLVGESINNIQEVTVREEDFHLLILYTNPNKRGDIKYNEISGWTDLGSIRDYSGILIGPKLEASEDQENLADVETTLKYLNGENSPYINGFTNPEDKGKILTVNDLDGVKQFYAYDYGVGDSTKQGWYYLGTLGENKVSNMIVTDNEDSALALPIGGIWFVEEN